jgi:hypothetical protein
MRKTIFFLLLFIPTFLFADIISGYVLGEDGDPIPYASVYVKTNPQLGTMTDSLGYYSININPSTDYSDHLIISFIGYRTEELSIASLQASQPYQTILVEQPIMLEGATVKAKISRKESRKIKKDALAKFIAQMRADFPERTAVYPIFSMYNGSQDTRQLMHHEVIGTITEYPIKTHHGIDSISLSVSSVKEYSTEEIKAGSELFNDITDDRLNTPKNKKKYKQIYTKRNFNDQALRMHRFLWGGPTTSFIDMLNIDKPNKYGKKLKTLNIETRPIVNVYNKKVVDDNGGINNINLNRGGGFVIENNSQNITSFIECTNIGVSVTELSPDEIN